VVCTVVEMKVLLDFKTTTTTTTTTTTQLLQAVLYNMVSPRLV
jgi:hypothetical protein